MTPEQPNDREVYDVVNNNSNNNKGKGAAPAVASDVPEEIIEEILVRVASAKSLMRFKCVCKSWLSLIRSSKFAAMHLERHQATSSSSSLSCSLSILMLHSNAVAADEFSSDAVFSVHSGDRDRGGRLVQICNEFPVANLSNGRVVGSCNGIICLLSTEYDKYATKKAPAKHFVHLWNPTTKELKKLPHNDSLLSRHLLCCDILLELFHDPLKDDYRVVCVAEYDNSVVLGRGDRGGCECKAGIYSLASDSWRMMDDMDNTFPSGSLGLICWSYSMVRRSSSGVVNGRYVHWIGKLIGSSEWFIARFDVEREVFDHPKFKPPLPDADWRIPQQAGLCNLFGCLAIVHDRAHTDIHGDGCSSTDIWVMKEYGVTDSWTKLVVINHADPYRCPPRSLVLETSGKLVLANGCRPAKVVWYDLKSANPCQATELGGGPYIYDYCQLYSHVQTIFPIKAAAGNIGFPNLPNHHHKQLDDRITQIYD